ncbi:Uncharacterised protein [[Clostridium] sordellii]|uniref:hypothetical protein n=1 Tax=Paraclostridium sordellii TaxID=1505 RepID=UPI0005DAB589|nr:hypothetical protein [Paeniclostridium sordellii]CEQ22514.1 Uncharacterised protein [[Clostridium] sordellii] [Paeniclostridium sordellii]
MSNLGLLLKISFLNTIGINKLRESSKAENIKKISIGILILFSIIVLMGSMFSLMLDLADMLKKSKSDGTIISNWIFRSCNF